MPAYRYQWLIQGRDWGTRDPPYFSTKMRPEGPKNFLGRPGSPLSQGLDDRAHPPPPPLSEGLDPPLAYGISICSRGMERACIRIDLLFGYLR